MLVRLLDNARRADPSGRPVEVALGIADDVVTVSVTDHGPALAPGELEAVFDAFAQGRQDGPGLGLRLARQIVTAHGGRMWATRPAGGGATFAFALPRVARPTGRVT